MATRRNGGGGAAAKPKSKKAKANNNNLNNFENLGIYNYIPDNTVLAQAYKKGVPSMKNLPFDTIRYRKALIDLVIENFDPRSTAGTQVRPDKILKGLGGDYFDRIIVKMIRFVRGEPKGILGGKQEIEVQVINPELMDIYLNFVRSRYERDIFLKVQKKKKPRLIECETFLINAMSYPFLNRENREEIKRVVEEAEIKGMLDELDRKMERVKVAEEDRKIQKRLNNLRKPTTGKISRKKSKKVKKYKKYRSKKRN